MQTWVTRRDLGIVTFKTTGTKPIAEHGALYPDYPWPLLQLKNWRLTGISYFVMSFNIKKENMKFNWHFHKGQNAIVLNQTRINSTWHIQMFWNKIMVTILKHRDLIWQMVAGKITGNRLLFNSSCYNDLVSTNNTKNNLVNKAKYSLTWHFIM